jgi:trimeric autotransporter adhesin
VSDAALKLQAVPASDTPKFSSGCGHDDGTSACDLGATDAASAQHKLQVQLTVPVTASTVKSVNLTVIGSTTGSAAQLPKALKASSAVSITAPSAAKTKGRGKSNTKTKTTTTPSATPSPGGTGAPPDTGTVISALPVANLPGIPAASSGLSPGGNASGLFPTLSPKPSAPASASASASASTSATRTATKQAAVAQAAAREAAAREVANTSALPEGASVVGIQLAGLAALAVAFVAAVTRFALRRRPAPAKRSPGTKADSQDTHGGD